MKEKLTLRKQIVSMQESWPSFDVLQQTRWFVRWEGVVRPFAKSYKVQIFLKNHRKHEGNKSSVFPPFPRVTVVAPLLRRRKGKPDDPIPHHYKNLACLEQPFLCLYYPPGREWDYGCSISQTTVPWTIEWLACYEGWLATGEWTGGGKH